MHYKQFCRYVLQHYTEKIKRLWHQKLIEMYIFKIHHVPLIQFGFLWKKRTLHIPSWSHRGFGLVHDVGAPFRPLEHAQNAKSVFAFSHIGVEPLHAAEVPHLHMPLSHLSAFLVLQLTLAHGSVI